MNHTERIGFIGLGEIGEPMAMRIFDAGYPMNVYNRTAARAAPFAARGVDVVSSPADVARGCDLIFLCVTDADAIEQLVFGPEGVAAGARPGQLLVDLSTTHPYATRDLAARLKKHAGVQWVDAPVSGGPGGARAGTLAVMVGGEAADIERARPVLMSFAGKMTYMGPVGCGVATKACNQMLSFCTASVLAETLNLAANFGIDPALIPEAVAGGFADSNVIRHLARPLIDATYAGDGVMGLKDVNIALELGRQTGSPLPMTSLMASMWQLVISQGFTRGGLGTTMRLYAQGPLVARQPADQNDKHREKAARALSPEALNALPVSAAPKDLVAAMQRQWAQAFARRDVDALVDLYAADCLHYGGQPDLANGRAGVRAYYDALPTQTLRVEFGAQSALRLGPAVVMSAGLATFFVGGVATEPYRFTQTFVHANGAWKIAGHHASLAAV